MAGANTTALLAHPPPASVLASHLGANLCPGCSIYHLAPCIWLDDCKTLTPVGNLEEISGSWPQNCSTLAELFEE